ncbi:MAG: tetratricopeptide repeat protein, partial [Opitutaceae bacterium]|nr:tetratricopeptide repeat protein [Opitutaceae bacterium]
MDASRLPGECNVDTLIRESVGESKAGRHSDAWQRIERAVALDPANCLAHLQRARCAAVMGLWAAARDSAAIASNTCELSVKEQMTLAAIFAHCGEERKALELYRVLETAQPADPHTQREIAVLSRILGRAEDAERACDRCLALDPDDHETIHRGGLGFSDRSEGGMTAIFFNDSRSIPDETTETQSLTGLQGEG